MVQVVVTLYQGLIDDIEVFVTENLAAEHVRKWIKENNIKVEDKSHLDTIDGLLEVIGTLSDYDTGKGIHWYECAINGDVSYVVADKDLNDLYVGHSLKDANAYLDEYGCDNPPAKIFKRIILEEQVA